MSSGISIPFGMLSQSKRQITHVLLTRSPLGVHELPHIHPVRLACLRHAASVRSEPGSNSPKKSFNERTVTLVMFLQVTDL